MEEVWKDVKNYEGLYQVSNKGKIKSLPRNGTIKKEKILKSYYDKDNYEIVTLSKNNINKKRRVHRLVAETFIENNHKLPVINHKNHDTKDNRVENLEWCTIKYNVEYSHNKEIKQCDLNGNCIKLWKSITEAGRNLKIDKTGIARACRGEYKTYGGYIWEFLDIYAGNDGEPILGIQMC